MIKPLVYGFITVALFNKGKPFVTSDGNKENAVFVWHGLLYRHDIKIYRGSDSCKEAIPLLMCAESTHQHKAGR